MRAAQTHCKIRPMALGDIPQVMDIERESFPTMWPQTTYRKELKNKLARYLVAYEPPSELPVEAAAPPREAAAPLKREPGLSGLLRRLFTPAPVTKERILGVVGLWCMMGEGHIVTIAVRESYRRQGIGELLLVAIMDTAQNAGQDGLTLEYRISNQEARKLYEKYGFMQVGVRARYYSDNQEDAVLMSTPPLRSSKYRKLLAARLSEQQARWGDEYPLAGAAAKLLGAAAHPQT